jgi:hypothetical protein
MHFETFGHWIGPILVVLVFNCSDLVVSDELGILLFADHEAVVVQSTFICDLLRNKLRVMSCWNTLINHLLLIATRQ